MKSKEGEKVSKKRKSPNRETEWSKEGSRKMNEEKKQIWIDCGKKKGKNEGGLEITWWRGEQREVRKHKGRKKRKKRREAKKW